MGHHVPGRRTPQQKIIAEYLALGLSAKAVAEQLKCSVTYVEVLSRGSLFQLEIDEARERLVGKKVKRFMAKLADELEPNLKRLKSIRDTAEKDGDALRAIEHMDGMIIKQGPEAATNMKVTLKLTDEKKNIASNAMKEADLEPEYLRITDESESES